MPASINSKISRIIEWDLRIMCTLCVRLPSFRRAVRSELPWGICRKGKEVWVSRGAVCDGGTFCSTAHGPVGRRTAHKFVQSCLCHLCQSSLP